MYNMTENNKKMFSIISNLQIDYDFKLDCQKIWPTYNRQVVN